MIASCATKTLWRRTASPAMGAVRNLNVHEYVSMELMKSHGIQTPECYVASNPEEAENVFLNSLNKGMYYSMYLIRSLSMQTQHLTLSMHFVCL